MAQSVWRTDSCLPRFTGRSEVKAVHLLELKNAAVVDFNAIAAKMEETSDRALAEMTALGGQVDRRAANVTNLERLVDQIRHRIEVLEEQQAGILVQMATPPSGMTPFNCPIACVGTVSYADGAETSGDNEVQVAIRNPTIEVKVSDSTNQSVYQENDQCDDQELDDEQSPELREAQVHRVNVLGFKSTVSIGTYSGAFSESLSSFVRQFKDQMRASDAEASETAQIMTQTEEKVNLTTNQRFAIARGREQGRTLRQLAEQFKVDRSTIGKFLKRWRAQNRQPVKRRHSQA
uniref:HTH_38 domain-containing protein n=1 Tax=Caenorhabditis japonica TaxID=281687 RepID=A0A8R1DV31_CAEJA